MVRVPLSPEQVNAPTAEEIAWGRRVLVAVEQHGEGALRFEGRMIDKPVIDLARTFVDYGRDLGGTTL